jgi:hypothetical protein
MLRKDHHLWSLQHLKVDSYPRARLMQLLEGTSSVEVTLDHLVASLTVKDAAVIGHPTRNLEHRGVLKAIVHLEPLELDSSQRVQKVTYVTFP